MNFPLWSTPVLAIIVTVFWLLQKKFPVEPEQPFAAVIVDWKLAGLHLAAKQLLLPITTACSAMAVNAAGGGWINLRSDGWWFLISFIILVITVDFWTYCAPCAT